MRFGKSLITGALRSDFATPLDMFHLAQDFSSRPTLSDEFIKDQPPISRIVGITPSASVPPFLFDAHVSCLAVQPMPSRGIPGLIDHF